MAITQQLVRLAPEEFGRCRADVSALRRVLAFGLAEERYLDLDWAPAGLAALAHIVDVQTDAAAGAGGAVAEVVIRRATDGDAPVNPDFPAGEVEVPPAALDAAAVRAIAAALTEIAAESLIGVLSKSAPDAGDRALGNLAPGERAGYVRRHFEALRAFYAEAAKRGECIIMWWD